MIEVWADIRGAFGCYQISNFGRLRSVDRIIKNINGKRLKLKGRIMKWNKGAPANDYYITRCLFRGTDHPKSIKCHIEVAKANNHWLNLEWSTRKENMKHAVDTGLIDTRGEKCGMSKLKAEDVITIREMFYEGEMSQSELGRRYNITPRGIGNIVNRETWKHI